MRRFLPSWPLTLKIRGVLFRALGTAGTDLDMRFGCAAPDIQYDAQLRMARFNTCASGQDSRANINILAFRDQSPEPTR